MSRILRLTNWEIVKSSGIKKPELLERLKGLKDNLKYLPKGQKPIVNPNEVREEFEWLQNRHLREVFSHPLEVSFRIKRVPNYKWGYPHCEPLWTPRLDQRAKWAPFQPYPAKMQKNGILNRAGNEVTKRDWR